MSRILVPLQVCGYPHPFGADRRRARLIRPALGKWRRVSIARSCSRWVWIRMIHCAAAQEPHPHPRSPAE